jgi:hypothetical protein
MRFSCIEFDLGEEDAYYRYRDLVATGSAIQTEEDLTDPYFPWIMEKDFQWYVERSEDGYQVFTVAFHEAHPFFNCFLLRSMRDPSSTGVYLFKEKHSLIPLDVVETWLLQFWKNYKRRNKKVKEL